MTDYPSISARLVRQGCTSALNHLQQSASALERHEWESANAQLRTFLEALYDFIAQVLVKSTKTGGAARKQLQEAGILTERNGKLLQAFMDAAGASGSHAGQSNKDEADGRFLMALGLALNALALIPELTRVEDILQSKLTAPAGTRLPTDAEIVATCPTCRTEQSLAASDLRRDGDDSVYVCKNGCQPIVVVGSPNSYAWPGRGYRMGEHVVRNASVLFIPLIGPSTAGIKLPASPAALMKQRPDAPVT